MKSRSFRDRSGLWSSARNRASRHAVLIDGEHDAISAPKIDVIVPIREVRSYDSLRAKPGRVSRQPYLKLQEGGPQQGTATTVGADSHPARLRTNIRTLEIPLGIARRALRTYVHGMAILAKVCQTSSSASRPFRIQVSNGEKPVSQVGNSVGRARTCISCWATRSWLKILSHASASRASAAAPDNLVMRKPWN